VAAAGVFLRAPSKKGVNSGVGAREINVVSRELVRAVAEPGPFCLSRDAISLARPPRE
jgi:hypothetical protein